MIPLIIGAGAASYAASKAADRLERTSPHWREDSWFYNLGKDRISLDDEPIEALSKLGGWLGGALVGANGISARAARRLGVPAFDIGRNLDWIAREANGRGGLAATVSELASKPLVRTAGLVVAGFVATAPLGLPLTLGGLAARLAAGPLAARGFRAARDSGLIDYAKERIGAKMDELLGRTVSEREVAWEASVEAQDVSVEHVGRERSAGLALPAPGHAGRDMEPSFG